MCCMRQAGNTWRKNNAKNRHLRTIAQLCRAIFSQLRHILTIGKMLVKQQCVLHMFLRYGELRPTSSWDRFGSLWSRFLSLFRSSGVPSNFDWFRVLAALLHGTLVVGVSRTLRRCTEGATYIRQGGHHVGHWPTFKLNIFSQLLARFFYIFIVTLWNN